MRKNSAPPGIPEIPGLTKNGLVVPEVAELGSVALDLCAPEHSYTKLQTNLFGL